MKVQRSYFMSILAGAGGLAIALAGCGSSGSSASGGGGGGGGGAATIEIGGITTQSGTYAFAGVPELQGMQLAIKTINASGGVNGKKLSLSSLDDAGTTSQSVSDLQKLASNSSVMAVVGPTATPVGNALGPVANQLKVPLLAMTGGAPVAAAGPWSFKELGASNVSASEVIDVAAAQAHVKKVAFVYDSDNEGQGEQAKDGEAALKSVGGTVTYQGTTTSTATDFGPVVSRIVASKPDAVFAPLVAQQMTSFITQLHDGGLPSSAIILGQPATITATFPNSPVAKHCCILGADWSPFSGTPGNAAFTSQFESQYHQIPIVWSALGYASVETIADVLKTCGASPSRTCLKNGLTTLKNEPTIMGHGQLTMTPARIAAYGSSAFAVGNGKYESVSDFVSGK